jgi:thiamine-phosphate pyrophosphorylase
MTLNLPRPILYLITRGATTETTTPDSEEFREVVLQASAAVTAGIQLIQIREKRLPARVLFELTRAVVATARGSSTKVLINNLADIAASAGADGVHLTTSSLTPDVIRKTFGPKFLIGASTHSADEARDAFQRGADFAVFGPIFRTPSKAEYGPPLGVGQLRDAARELTSLPLIALGGVSVGRVNDCLRAGAAGVAGITLFSKPEDLAITVAMIRNYAQVDHGRSVQ